MNSKKYEKPGSMQLNRKFEVEDSHVNYEINGLIHVDALRVNLHHPTDIEENFASKVWLKSDLDNAHESNTKRTTRDDVNASDHEHHPLSQSPEQLLHHKPTTATMIVDPSLPEQSEKDFNYQMMNVQLTPIHKFAECSDIPSVNEINQWLRDNILSWDLEKKAPLFYLPRGYSSLNSPTEILTTFVTNKPIAVIEDISTTFLSQAAASAAVVPPKQQTQQVSVQMPQSRQPKRLTYQNVYDELNSQQKSDIWNSSKFTIDYEHGESEVWKLRPWVFYGKERTNKLLLKFFGFAKFQLKQIGRRFFTDETVELIRHNLKNQKMDSEHCQCGCLDLNILEGLRVIMGIPVHLIILLIGIPLYEYDKAKEEALALRTRCNRIEEKLLSEESSPRYVDMEFTRHLLSNKELYLSTDFGVSEESYLIFLLKQIHDGKLKLSSSDASKQSSPSHLVKFELQEKIYEEILNRVETHLSAKTEVSESLIKSLRSTFRSYYALRNSGYAWPHRGGDILPYHPSSSRRLLPSDYFSFARRDLSRLGCEKQSQFVALLETEFAKKFTSSEERAIAERTKTVSHTIQLQFQRLKPVVVRSQSENGVAFTSLLTVTVKIATSFFFWKVAFFFSASFFMIQKFMNACFIAAIYSDCGLKAALLTQPFASGYIVEQRTGKIIEDPKSFKPTISSRYEKIKEQAREEVRAFEEEPDHGLLGKSITRLCNRLVNWVLMYFIVGFIGVNILQRLLFIFAGLFCLMLVPLCIFIAPIYTTLCFLVCLLIYDFTVPNHSKWDLPILVPLFDLFVWRLFGRGLGQIVMCIIMIFFHILSSVLLVILGLILYLVRRALDTLVFFFIYWCARIPGGDSYLAKRVRTVGGGTHQQNKGKNQSYSSSKSIVRTATLQSSNQLLEQLNLQQIIILIDAEFDKQILEHYRIEMKASINLRVAENDMKIMKLLQHLPFEFTGNKVSRQYTQTAQKIIGALDHSIAAKKKQLPALNKKGHANFQYKRENLIQLYQAVQQHIQVKYARNTLFRKLMWPSLKCNEDNYAMMTLTFFNLFFFDQKQSLATVLDKLTLKEQPSKNVILKQQVDDFLIAKLNLPKNAILQEPPAVVSFQQFIERIFQRHEPSQPLVMLKQSQQPLFIHLEDCLILNTNVLVKREAAAAAFPPHQ